MKIYQTPQIITTRWFLGLFKNKSAQNKSVQKKLLNHYCSPVESYINEKNIANTQTEQMNLSDTPVNNIENVSKESLNKKYYTN